MDLVPRLLHRLCARTHACTHTHTRTCTHTHTHMHTVVHTHSCMHTHIYTHVCMRVLGSNASAKIAFPRHTFLTYGVPSCGSSDLEDSRIQFQDTVVAYPMALTPHSPQSPQLQKWKQQVSSVMGFSLLSVTFPRFTCCWLHVCICTWFLFFLRGSFLWLSHTPVYGQVSWFIHSSTDGHWVISRFGVSWLMLRRAFVCSSVDTRASLSLGHRAWSGSVFHPLRSGQSVTNNA